MPSLADQALSLPPAGRLRLIDQIWQSLATHPEDIPVTESVLDELDRRRKRYQDDPTSLRDWDEVQHKIAEERGTED